MYIPTELHDKKILINFLTGKYSTCQEAINGCSMAVCEKECVLINENNTWSPLVYNYGINSEAGKFDKARVYKQLKETGLITKSVMLVLELDGVLLFMEEAVAELS